MPDVGEVIAESIWNFFRSPANLEEIERLKAAGLHFAAEGRAQAVSAALAGKSIVISGNFSISRDAMKALIEAHGGKNSSSVSGKTDYLLAGAKPGPEKIKKAADLGIPVIDEDTFRALIESAGGSTSPDAFARTGSQSDASGEVDPPTATQIDEIEPTLF